MAHGVRAVTFSNEWQVLGPFQIGTREATWGADPLEYHGGFRSLEYDTKAVFQSSIGQNGTVGWKSVNAGKSSESRDHDCADLKIQFPDIDWTFQQSVFGWSAFQYQAWARGEIVINSDRKKTIVLYTDEILEFWLDNELHFGGDFYAFHRAPLVVHLEPGPHRLDLRLIREVRSMGGIGDPVVNVRVAAQVSNEVLRVQIDKILLPELIHGKLTSKHASIPIRNEGQSWIHLKSVEVRNSRSSSVSQHVMSNSSPFAVAPGQSRPLVCELVASDLYERRISFFIKYLVDGDDRVQSLIFTSQLTSRDLHKPQRFTFMGVGGAVSYAILQPPPSQSSSAGVERLPLPVLVNLHGAGVDADSEQVRHQLDAASDLPAWVIFPSGGSDWCGDDWHTVGFSDVNAAIASIPDWIHSIGWTGPGVNRAEILFSGHSNGGQGTWFAATHRPDLAIAAAPVSGYSSIQAYVTYNMWHEMDPKMTAILGTSLLNYRHELLLSNLAGIPILQQHGDVDDNVPVFHSRRLKQLLSQNGGSSEYVELKGKNHWFDGIMTSDPLRNFYDNVLRRKSSTATLPDIFEFVIPNSGDLGSKGGIHVDQLISPDHLGHIKVSRVEGGLTWVLRTSNVLRFHFSLESRQSWPKHIAIDSRPPLPVKEKTEHENQYFVKGENGSWTMLDDDGWKQIGQRRGVQLGALDAFLRTSHRFRIDAHNLKSLKIPVQISRSLFQYFGADAEISLTEEASVPSGGNVVHVSTGFPALPNISLPFPIQVLPDKTIIITDAKGRIATYPVEAGLGAVFLMPLPAEKLALIVWGADQAGLDQAARLIPALTGTGQPDFIVCNRECTWKGAAGVLAAGFFDHRWAVSEGSYFR